MKKIDLHVHTVPANSDSHFDFSFEKMKEYVTVMEVDCIAITNHNLFDKTQFETISSSLEVVTLPGIEIDLAGGHMLLISENKDLDDFSEKCKQVEVEVAKSGCISLEIFQNIFQDLSRYLLIPHYDKKPIIDEEIINSLSDYISAGEVASVRKFKSCLKEEKKLVPVLFSDTRFYDDLPSFSTRQTFIPLEEMTFTGIRSCLYDKNKVFLSRDDGNELFSVTEDGLKISTGLNVVFGERSSGKTFMLDKISESFEKVKYIKQFSLLQNDEAKFEDLMSVRNSKLSEIFMKEFKDMVEDVAKIDLKQNEIDIDNYITSLVKFANENEKMDAYSATTLFSENLYSEIPQASLKKLIDSTKNLIDNSEYRQIIEVHVTIQSLKDLVLSLIIEFTITEELNLKRKWLNDLISTIQNDLKVKTNCTFIENIDFHTIAAESEKVKRFEQIIANLKIEREISRIEIRGFKIVARLKCFGGATQLQKICKRKLRLTDAYELYEKPYEYLQCLKDKTIEETELYKYFVDIEFITLNKHGVPVSGGERSEFNLLHEISDALKHDLLLLDEPESSFDNLFLKNEVNELIKDIASEIPVIVVTHNNTVGASIKPNYLLYTAKKISNGAVEYNIYTGYPADKELKALDGEKVSNFEVMLNSLEAGSDTYDERRKVNYEILKD